MEVKRVLKEDVGLELNVSKTSVLIPKGDTQQVVFDDTHSIINNRLLTQCRGDVSLTSF